MARTIDRFVGRYRFLSNFYLCIVSLDDEMYPSVEHAYQAAKFPINKRERFTDTGLKPGEAKGLGGGKAPVDWHSRSLGIMRDLLRQKFREPRLRNQLIETNDAVLIEGNYWHDTFYGVCDGRRCRYSPHEPKGDNNLGRLLMQLRREINGQDD